MVLCKEANGAVGGALSSFSLDAVISLVICVVLPVIHQAPPSVFIPFFIPFLCAIALDVFSHMLL